jgi:glycosyl transferase family 7 (putative galactosyltransferase)
MIPLTIVYCTNRVQPHFQWFVDAICNQADFDQRRHLQVIFIDGQLWSPTAKERYDGRNLNFDKPIWHDTDRRLELELVVNNRLDYLHIPPLPSVYQGPFRLTKSDWFSASNTRNSGFVVAKYPYCIFIDDLTVPGTIWLAQALHAAQHGYCVAGMYKKVRKLLVANGIAVSYEEFPEGRDSRWEYGSDAGIGPWDGSIFGCSFGVTLESALKIDGFEMACCGSGNEDSDFGIRLRRSGVKVMLNRNLFTMESEEDHHTQEFKSMATRDRRAVIKENLPTAYESYQIPNQAEKYMSDHVLINRVVNEARIVPILPQNLRGMREKWLGTGLVDVPTGPKYDWRDNTPLSEL